MWYKEDIVNYFAAVKYRPRNTFDCCDGCRAANAPRKVMKTKKPQRQKQNVRRVQELRRSNAAQPIPAGTDYKRNLKYGIKWEDDDDDLSLYYWR